MRPPLKSYIFLFQQGIPAHKTGVYLWVHEDLSTGLTILKQKKIVFGGAHE